MLHKYCNLITTAYFVHKTNIILQTMPTTYIEVNEINDEKITLQRSACIDVN